MGNYNTIKIKINNNVAEITLNRPDVHNAFNNELIGEFLTLLNELEGQEGLRVIIITGEGKSFCAGADINWMREVINYSFSENLRESNRLAELLHKLYNFPIPTIARVNGAAIGGGCGFVSACDIAIAWDDATFSLSEVKIGLIPACICPFVINRLGESKTREMFLTGKRIHGKEAERIGLVNYSVPLATLDEKVSEYVNLILSGGKDAQKKCKELIKTIKHLDEKKIPSYTAEMIANLRISKEGQEGMRAFLEKRKPRW